MGFWNVLTHRGRNSRAERFADMACRRNPALATFGKRLADSSQWAPPWKLVRALELSQDSNTRSRDFAALFEDSRTGKVRLIRSANATHGAFGRRTVVGSTLEAIGRLGPRAVTEVAYKMMTAGLFTSGDRIGTYSARALWRHSLSVAAVTRRFYVHIFGNTFDHLDPFLVGLLHDVGILAEQDIVGKAGFVNAVREQDECGCCLVQTEKKHLRLTHEEAGAVVMRHWGLPEEYQEVVGSHHQPVRSESPECERVLHVLKLAEWMCHQWDAGYADFTEEETEAYVRSWDWLGLLDSEYGRIAERASQELKHLERLGWFAHLSLRPIPAGRVAARPARLPA